MEQIVTTLISALSPSALPVVVLCLGGLYLWFKFGRMEKDRQETKNQRDSDSQAIHDNILKLKFDVTNLKGITNLHRDKLDSIDKQLGLVNQELTKLNIQVGHLTAALERQNELMMDTLKDKEK